LAAPPGAVIARTPQPHPANQLLAALPAKTYQRLQAALERVELKFGDVLYQPGDIARHVYFPNDSLVSLLVAVEGNGALEVGMVGREGMVGIPLALGKPTSPVRVLVQGGGSAMRMSGKRLARELKNDGGLKQQLDRCRAAKGNRPTVGVIPHWHSRDLLQDSFDVEIASNCRSGYRPFHVASRIHRSLDGTEIPNQHEFRNLYEARANSQRGVYFVPRNGRPNGRAPIGRVELQAETLARASKGGIDRDVPVEALQRCSTKGAVTSAARDPLECRR